MTKEGKWESFAFFHAKELILLHPNYFSAADMESARCAPPKIPSLTRSAASKGDQIPPTNEETSKKQETVEQIKDVNAPHQNLDKQGIEKVTDTTEQKHELLSSVKEPASQGSGRLADGEVQQKPASSETGKIGKIFLYTCFIFRF